MSRLSEAARRCRARAEVGCHGKQGFGSYALAMDVAKAGRRRRDKRIAAYRCAHCALFHVGNGRRLRMNRSEVDDA